MILSNSPKFKISWLTLIEVLLAILLFGSWIVVILSIIIQNISLAQRIQDKTVATMLAKEAIEMFYSYKDTNIDRWEYWDTYWLNYFIAWTEYHIQRVDDGWKKRITIDTSPINALIEYKSIHQWDNIFKHGTNIDSDWKTSKFVRYCKFSELINWLIEPENLKRSVDGWHLAMQIDCTVESVSQSITSRKVKVTLSSIIWQNRE